MCHFLLPATVSVLNSNNQYLEWETDVVYCENRCCDISLFYHTPNLDQCQLNHWQQKYNFEFDWNITTHLAAVPVWTSYVNSEKKKPQNLIFTAALQSNFLCFILTTASCHRSSFNIWSTWKCWTSGPLKQCLVRLVWLFISSSNDCKEGKMRARTINFSQIIQKLVMIFHHDILVSRI